MKRWMIVPFILFISTLCFADVTIVQKMETGAMMGQPAQNTVMTMYVKGNKGRIETKANPSYQILDLQANKMYMVDPSKKEVMVMSLDMMKAAGGMMSGMGKNMKFNIQKTGKTMNISGYNCQEYNITASGLFNLNVNQWVTEDIEIKEFEAFREFTEGMMRMIGQEEMMKIKGVAVRSESKMNMMGQDVTSRTELQSISQDSLPDSLFSVPSDFQVKEMNLPKMQQQ